MAKVNGSQVLARALALQGVDTLFYLMGGPMLQAAACCIGEGLRAIDVRHEQAAAMMAHAWGRVTQRVAACMAASGPGTANLVTGVANAWADASPLLAIGGAAPLAFSGKGVFQECDQLGLFRTITKWADRCHDPAALPDMVAAALRIARSGRPGPVYLDVPGDVLVREVDEEEVPHRGARELAAMPRPAATAEAVEAAIDLLARARRPVLVSGSGILWSQASPELRAFVEATGIPFYTTPQGRGVLPDDHPLSFLAARTQAFREADCIFVAATRMNYVNAHFAPPRFRPDARVIQVNVDPCEIGLTRTADVGLAGDAKVVFAQLLERARGRVDPARWRGWVDELRTTDRTKSADQERRMAAASRPIHPLRLCREVRDFLDRDAYLVVDGQEILNYGRQSIPTYEPGHRLNSGTWGTMGVGLPFGIGVKVAHPDKQVLVLHGDGSFGLNGMELDTAVRHRINVVCVISLNGGWTADPEGVKPGRDLGFTRYDRMAEALGCHGEYVEDPEQIRPALERAFAAGRPAVVNVKTDPMARAVTTRFTLTST